MSTPAPTSTVIIPHDTTMAGRVTLIFTKSAEAVVEELRVSLGDHRKLQQDIRKINEGLTELEEELHKMWIFCSEY